MSSVAILVPVLNRPHRVEPLLQSIAAATEVPHRVIFGCSDQPTVDELDRLGAWYIRDEGGAEGTWPKRINRLFTHVLEPYILTGADDLAFRPGWFEAAMIAMSQLPDGSGVVGVNDLHNPASVHFIMCRKYIEKFGGAMEPGVPACDLYEHQYTDDDIRASAIFHGRWIIAKDSVIEHLHVGAGKAPMDETYRMGEASSAQGHAVFQSRAHLWAVPQ